MRSNLPWRLASKGFGPLTVLLMIACIGAFLARFFVPGTLEALCVSQVDIADANSAGLMHGLRERLAMIFYVLPEIRHGQIWRLLSPVLLHMTFLQLFFSVFWLRELGSTIEDRQGALAFVVLVLVFA